MRISFITFRSINAVKIMRNIYTIGETVLDLIFDPSKNVITRPGGAMLNTSISLGRLNLKVSFITEIGNDKAGNYILDFLHQNHVETSFLFQFKNGQTAIALAFLDENENADYSFYKNYPNERLCQKMPLISFNDVVLFGSFFSITKEVRVPLKGF